MPANPDSAAVPTWMADATWYQVFVARFCNGTPLNDPPGTLRWTEDWRRVRPGESPASRPAYFGRRYGGDLQGLGDRLSYIRGLGVTALYLNPVFQAASEHKYDTADHRHVDQSFSLPAPSGFTAAETHDPATWSWTPGDRVFLSLLDEAHRMGMKVVIDGVFNHVGQEFWAWRDVLANGRESRYADWFAVTDWGPPLQWKAWDGPNGRLVEFCQSSDGLHPEVERYLFDVVRRWMDPDGDGNPADGVDGWRLDAAEKLPHGFWRRFRQAVKEVNPDAAIVGEIWIDARPWLDGPQFDVVTNYRFRDPLIRFLSQIPSAKVADNAVPDSALDGTASPSAGVVASEATTTAMLPPSMGSATGLIDALARVRIDYPSEVAPALWNLLGSHDTARAVTVLAKRSHTRPPSFGEDGDSGPQATPPELADYGQLALAVVFQFTYIGAPMIYYGDEVGMFGGNDPFCRAPMWWMEHGLNGYRSDIYNMYRRFSVFRYTRKEWRRGSCHILLADDARRLVAYSRRLGKEETVVLINAGDAAADVFVHVGGKRRSLACLEVGVGDRWIRLLPGGSLPVDREGRIRLHCGPREARVMMSGL